MSALRRVSGARLAAAVLAPVLLVAGLAGCSASTAPDGTAAAPAPTSRPVDAVLPAVTNAADLHRAPQIAAGHGRAPSQLLTRDLVTGSGSTATAASTVTIRYTGVLWRDGKEFDSTWGGTGAGAGQPATFPLANTITGFGRGINGMKVGGRREILIPPALGYGPMGGQPPTILADDTLVFVVDLISLGDNAGTLGSGSSFDGGASGSGAQP
ncbi:FKBP-type peptidyl-prolyl cis-trans isomerase [Frankia sp. R82]|uniref:FKBP-type peptidyl-prolyl cis-trans isomerase n=1 Tax=Frankia sp. R82 TaxID=2950553 RepID=UPI0020435E36|nr:FKBP-type peptidyl-prolyl cis-trans isomerase [Frankia sp. R82]MCM3887537.1 FKBP-type peptidyl-prolyl cis-trans isomerase [Frankia sp. R82]